MTHASGTHASDKRLLIVSPVRNEADHIERVVRAMAAQTRRVDAWIVVDDGSDDDTLRILRELEPTVPFMCVLEAPSAEIPASAKDRLALAADTRTFNFGLRSLDWRDFTHIGKLDGDVELPPDYYERMLVEFAANPRLGLAGGCLVEQFGTESRRIAIPPHHVHGAVKLYSAECFEAIGGLQERLGWDTIDGTYARMRGFATCSFGDLVGVHHRVFGSAQGRLRGRARHGTCAWIAHYPPIWVLARSLKLATLRPRGASGAAFFYGYARAAFVGVPRVQDDEFRRLTRRELRRRLVGTLTRRELSGSPG
jgi:hypothetical protein